MKWIVLFSLVSTNAFSAIWIPNEKEIWSLIRKAERTPEMQIKFRHPGIEKLNVDRTFEIVTNCHLRKVSSNGISKIYGLESDTMDCFAAF